MNQKKVRKIINQRLTGSIPDVWSKVVERKDEPGHELTNIALIGVDDEKPRIKWLYSLGRPIWSGIQVVVVLIVLFLVAFFLFRNGINTTNETTSETTNVAGSEATSSTSPGNTSQSISGGLNFPFREPDSGQVKFENGRYYFSNVTPDDLNEYIDLLVTDGFSVQESEYRYFLHKDNVFVDITNNTRAIQEFDLLYIEGMPAAKPGTLSCEQAQSILGDDHHDIIEMFVPDLYEKTGAQLFYAAPLINKADSDWPLKFLIINNQAFPLESTPFDQYQVCDIDKDNNFELLYLLPGPTSGLFSFEIAAVGFDHGNIMNKYKNIFTPGGVYILTFKEASAADIYLYSAIYVNYRLTPSLKLYKIEVSGGRLILTDDNG